MNLDELLCVVPGVRRMRRMNASLLRTLLDRRKGECTWCGNPVPKGRLTWCSDECVAAYRERCDCQTQATLVEARDNWTCQVCGRDIKAAMKDGHDAGHAARESFQHQYSKEAFDAQKAAWSQFGWSRGHWCEVDHVVPVIEWGGLLGISNLRLLCGECHAEATRQLASRRKLAQ